MTVDKFHDIEVIFGEKTMTVRADNKTLFKGEGNYKQISAPLGIWPSHGSVVTVKNFQVKPGTD